MRFTSQFFVLPVFCLLVSPAIAQGHSPITPQLAPHSVTKGGGNATIQQAADRIQAAGGTIEAAKPLPGTYAGKIGDPNVYAKTITGPEIYAHLSFLASDVCEGRETGERGQKIAAQYLASQFQKMGLQPGNNGKWYQEFTLNRVELNDVAISFDSKTQLKRGRDFVYWDKYAMSESFTAPLAFAGFGISDSRYDNLANTNLQGKVVFILSGEPVRDGKPILSGTLEPSNWGNQLGLKLDALEKAGAKAVIVIQANERFQELADNPRLQHAMQGYSLSLEYQSNTSMPVIAMPERSVTGLFKKAGYGLEELRNNLNGSEKVPAVNFKKASYTAKADAFRKKVVTENVLGLLEGTDKKDEIIVLTAHYDHLGMHDGKIFYGADDDGSGTSAILELAEAFAAAAKEGYRPRRSILFMPVSGEEKGLLGSEYYADHPVFPLANTVCNLNIDMIGRVDPAHEKDSNYVYIIGSDKLSSELHDANEMANKIVSKITLDYTYNAPGDPNRFYYRSDHYNFAKNNIPVIFYFTGVHADYHKATDTIDKIMIGKAAKITQLVFGTAWEVANREKRLVVDRKNDFED
jgi:hypothetical protein